MIKGAIKAALKRIAPDYYATTMAVRENRHGQRVLERYGVPKMAQLYAERYGFSVKHGPFAGMSYIESSAGSTFIPKLVGSYEAELHPVVERILAQEYQVVLDVGSAEGYYAVGLAMRLPGNPEIYAYDINPEARALCAELVSRNGVESRVRLSGACDTAELQARLNGRSLIVCDCEGYELTLLQPDKAPALASAEILVELHDCFQPGITPTIVSRFEGTHDIQFIDAVERDASIYPELDFFPADKRWAAISEFRPGKQQWAYLVPK